MQKKEANSTTESGIDRFKKSYEKITSFLIHNNDDNDVKSRQHLDTAFNQLNDALKKLEKQITVQ